MFTVTLSWLTGTLVENRAITLALLVTYVSSMFGMGLKSMVTPSFLFYHRLCISLPTGTPQRTSAQHEMNKTPLDDFDSCVFLLQTMGSTLFIFPLLIREVRAMWQERQAMRHQLWERQHLAAVMFRLLWVTTPQGLLRHSPQRWVLGKYSVDAVCHRHDGSREPPVKLDDQPRDQAEGLWAQHWRLIHPLRA